MCKKRREGKFEIRKILFDKYENFNPLRAIPQKVKSQTGDGCDQILGPNI